MRPALAGVSPERIFAELKRIVAGDARCAASS
jgi:hypothetical protein